MAKTATPIFVQTPAIGTANLCAVTACTTRAPIATANLATNNLVLLHDVTTDGRRVDKVTVFGASTSMSSTYTAGIVTIWHWDSAAGLATIVGEIPVAAQTCSVTAPYAPASITLDPLGMNAADKLYASTSVTTTAAVNALVAKAFGGAY